MGSPSAPKRIFVLDMMRSRSNVFIKLFANHPDIHMLFYPFALVGVFGPEVMYDKVTNSPTANEQLNQARAAFGTKTTYTEAAQSLAHQMSTIEKDEDKVIMCKEHTWLTIRQDLLLALLSGEESYKSIVESAGPCGNPTYLPDNIWDTLTPVFLIRHPACLIPSGYKVQISTGNALRPTDESFRFMFSAITTRFFADVMIQQGREFIIVDGDDIVYRYEELIPKLCGKLGISREGVHDTWKEFDLQELLSMGAVTPLFQSYFNDLMGSTGVRRKSDQSTRPDIDVDREEANWAEQWGAEAAKQLRVHVDRDLEHWEYLASLKM